MRISRLDVLPQSPRRRRSRSVTVALSTLQVLAAGMFFLAGTSKLAGTAAMVQVFDMIGVGQWFRYVAGSVDVVSAVLLAASSVVGWQRRQYSNIRAVVQSSVHHPQRSLWLLNTKWRERAAEKLVSITMARNASLVAFTAMMGFADALLVAWLYGSAWGMAVSGGAILGLIVFIAWTWRHTPRPTRP
jgi:Na+/H+-translocating membrane pyrophosphatase